EQVGVDARDDDGDPFGAAQAAEDLGDPAGTGGVEGEDVPARTQQGVDAVQPPARLALSGGGEVLVVHAFQLDRAGLPEGDAVGAVAQFDGGAVHVADRERIAAGEQRALRVVQAGEEAGQPGRLRLRVRQPPSGDAAVAPRVERGLQLGRLPLAAYRR